MLKKKELKINQEVFRDYKVMEKSAPVFLKF